MTKTKTKLSPIARAVAPLKVDAIERAEKEARSWIEVAVARLEAANGDLDLIAPGPGRNESRESYKRKSALRAAYYCIVTTKEKVKRYDPTEKTLFEGSPTKMAKFIEDCKADAAAAYEAFIYKLEGKIGETKKAGLLGNHVWGFSILSVTKPNGEVEKWKTKQIVNHSKLGKFFNQWPSRKVK